MITNCIHCDAFIDTKYGAYPPSEHQDHSGSEDDPMAPGDYDNICAVCNYDKGLRGGTRA